MLSFSGVSSVLTYSSRCVQCAHVLFLLVLVPGHLLLKMARARTNCATTCSPPERDHPRKCALAPKATPKPMWRERE